MTSKLSDHQPQVIEAIASQPVIDYHGLEAAQTGNLQSYTLQRFTHVQTMIN
tara:strand:+ start:4348 stop:4503 length:156 start_codon:yes stop_codon:yes gene_type:complete